MAGQLCNVLKTKLVHPPCSRRQYNTWLGENLEVVAHRALRKLGYKIKPHGVYEPGADIESPAITGECLNFARNSYINKKRQESINSNLRGPIKLLITSHRVLTKAQRRWVKKAGIIWIVVGKQLLIRTRSVVTMLKVKIHRALQNVAVIHKPGSKPASNSSDTTLKCKYPSEIIVMVADGPQITCRESYIPAMSSLHSPVPGNQAWRLLASGVQLPRPGDMPQGNHV